MFCMEKIQSFCYLINFVKFMIKLTVFVPELLKVKRKLKLWKCLLKSTIKLVFVVLKFGEMYKWKYGIHQIEGSTDDTKGAHSDSHLLIKLLSSIKKHLH